MKVKKFQLEEHHRSNIKRDQKNDISGKLKYIFLNSTGLPYASAIILSKYPENLKYKL